MKRQILVFGIAAIVLAMAPGHAQPSGTGEVYTLINLWVERPKPIPTTNYHKGERIPIGSVVRIISTTGSAISFSCNGETLTLQKTKHTLVGMDAVEARTFGTMDPLASDAFKALPEAQRNAVKNGLVIVGMSKAAVLMAYGFPPEHKTPTTEGNTWLYWADRFRQQSVTFADGKVSSMAGF